MSPPDPAASSTVLLVDVDGTITDSFPGIERSVVMHGAGRFGIPTILAGWGYARPGERDEAAWSVPTVADLREVLGV